MIHIITAFSTIIAAYTHYFLNFNNFNVVLDRVLAHTTTTTTTTRVYDDPWSLMYDL